MSIDIELNFTKFMLENNFNISGDYQFEALNHGKLLQKAWHALRLEAAEYSLRKIEYINVLDAGCGSGVMLNAVSSSAMNLTGVDFSESSVKFAKKYLAEFSPAIMHAEIENTGVPNDSQDLVLCCEVLEHVEQCKAVEALNHFYKILRPGGYLYITVPNKKSMWPVLEKFLDMTKLVPQLNNTQHITEYSLGKMKPLIENVGFSICEKGTFNFMSPLFYALAKPAGKFVLKTELKFLRFGGPLLYFLAKKI